MKLTIAKPIVIPSDITVCPECGGILIVQATTPDIRDIILDCKNDTKKNPHRWHQGEWEVPYAQIRCWIRRGCVPRKLIPAKLLGLTTADGLWSGELFCVRIGATYQVDITSIRRGTIYRADPTKIFAAEFIDLDRDGNGRFWPWPTELLKFERPQKANKTVVQAELI